MNHSAPTLEPQDACELEAYNAAFRELELPWRWTEQTWMELKRASGHEERVRHYIEAHHPHLLRAYDAAFLAAAIRGRMASAQDAMRGSLQQRRAA